MKKIQTFHSFAVDFANFENFKVGEYISNGGKYKINVVKNIYSPLMLTSKKCPIQVSNVTKEINIAKWFLEKTTVQTRIFFILWCHYKVILIEGRPSGLVSDSTADRMAYVSLKKNTKKINKKILFSEYYEPIKHNLTHANMDRIQLFKNLLSLN